MRDKGSPLTSIGYDPSEALVSQTQIAKQTSPMTLHESTEVSL